MSHATMAASQSSPPRCGSPPVERTSITPPPTCHMRSQWRQAARSGTVLGLGRCLLDGARGWLSCKLHSQLTTASRPKPAAPTQKPACPAARPHLQQGHVVGAAPQVQHQHGLVLRGIQPIRQRCCHRLPANEGEGLTHARVSNCNSSGPPLAAHPCPGGCLQSPPGQPAPHPHHSYKCHCDTRAIWPPPACPHACSAPPPHRMRRTVSSPATRPAVMVASRCSSSK